MIYSLLCALASYASDLISQGLSARVCAPVELSEGLITDVEKFLFRC